MDLARYLARVGYTGPTSPTLETLTALHRAHLLAIPYENLDIHLGRRLPLDPERIYRKLVVEERGGWCYEMNGLFAAVLSGLGFQVALLGSVVGRARGEPVVEGGHLVLLVTLDRQYLVDVGFGDGFLEPIPLREGRYRRAGFAFRLERQGARWILHNHPDGGAPGYDFTLEARALWSFGDPCHELQTRPTSSFVRLVICQRHTEGGLITLRGAVFREVRPSRVEETVVKGADHFATILSDRFGLTLADADAALLWSKVEVQHERWMAERSAGQARS